MMGQPQVTERVVPEQMISFVNEDLRGIRPRDISEIPAGAIAIIKATGVMSRYFNWWTESAEEIVAQLDWANNIDNIAAIVLVIDGPGGAASAANVFVDFASRKRKPIVAVMDNSLSLHRWLPDAIADLHLASNPITGRFGSYGVVSSWLDVREYYKKMGVEEKEVYADESDLKNEVWRTMIEDEEKGMQMLRDQHLKPMAQQFQAAGREAHPDLDEKKYEGAFRGRTYTAAQALEMNMIDGIGNLQEGIRRAQMLAELQSFKQGFSNN